MDLLNETVLLKTKRTLFNLLVKETSQFLCYERLLNMTNVAYKKCIFQRNAILVALLYSGFISSTILTISIKNFSRIPFGCKKCVFLHDTRLWFPDYYCSPPWAANGPSVFHYATQNTNIGVQIDGFPRQLNFLMDKHETIGRDGTLTHGPNTVISMLDWTLDHYGNDEPSCAFHADNCSGKYNINLLCENQLTIMMRISLHIHAV